MNDTERWFERAMVDIYLTAKRELGYNATRRRRVPRFPQRKDPEPEGQSSLSGHYALGSPAGMTAKVCKTVTYRAARSHVA
ncbi:hypothetical protein [Planobispora takensis]|uniref:Uncharacterized protein n=1 Tax=Planobispora takensis TaxID=1367882 RepID=A0A8J3WR51_9ACTN|nr:hypothetical protein [Planobispora takensis]GIH99168.1 hypothetical protein Pta02_11770 [Planobispora takensis]